MSKGVFIEGITVDMLRNACLEAVEELLNEGDMIDMEVKPTEWIPVSERLPEYRRIVLVSSYWGVTVAIRDAVKEDGTDDFWSLLLRDSDTGMRYIYAWMPLPEPYREGGDGGEEE